MDITWAMKVPNTAPVFQLLPANLDEINDLVVSCNYPGGVTNEDGKWVFPSTMTQGVLEDNAWVLFDANSANVIVVDPANLAAIGFQPAAGQEALYTTELAQE